MNPLLRPGITGFFPSAAALSAAPRVSEEAFASACHAVARAAGMRLLELRAPSVTPNFHLGTFSSRDERIAVLCNGTFPVVAFVRGAVDFGATLQFVSHAPLAESFARSGFECLPANALERPLRSDDCAQLTACELKQVRHWNPSRVGDVVFHWWD